MSHAEEIERLLRLGDEAATDALKADVVQMYMNTIMVAVPLAAGAVVALTVGIVAAAMTTIAAGIVCVRVGVQTRRTAARHGRANIRALHRVIAVVEKELRKEDVTPLELFCIQVRLFRLNAQAQECNLGRDRVASNLGIVLQ